MVREKENIKRILSRIIIKFSPKKLCFLLWLLGIREGWTLLAWAIVMLRWNEWDEMFNNSSGPPLNFVEKYN